MLTCGMGESRGPVALSIVAAAHNEQDNVDRLVTEICAALEPSAIDFWRTEPGPRAWYWETAE